MRADSAPPRRGAPVAPQVHPAVSGRGARRRAQLHSEQRGAREPEEAAGERRRSHMRAFERTKEREQHTALHSVLFFTVL